MSYELIKKIRKSMETINLDYRDFQIVVSLKAVTVTLQEHVGTKEEKNKDNIFYLELVDNDLEDKELLKMLKKVADKNPKSVEKGKQFYKNINTKKGSLPK